MQFLSPYRKDRKIVSERLGSIVSKLRSKVATNHKSPTNYTARPITLPPPPRTPTPRSLGFLSLGSLHYFHYQPLWLGFHDTHKFIFSQNTQKFIFKWILICRVFLDFLKISVLCVSFSICLGTRKRVGKNGYYEPI